MLPLGRLAHDLPCVLVQILQPAHRAINAEHSDDRTGMPAVFSHRSAAAHNGPGPEPATARRRPVRTD